MAIVDQGIFSGNNFIFNILLARWLLPSAYGAFAVSFTILLVFYQLHSSLLLDPISILGAAKHLERLHSYFWKQIRLHFVITSIFGALIILGASLYKQFPGANTQISKVLTVMGLLLPFQLLPWLLRRIFYVLQKPSVSAIGSIANAFVIIMGLAILMKASMITPSTALGVMALGGLCGTVVMLFWLRGSGGERLETNIIASP